MARFMWSKSYFFLFFKVRSSYSEYPYQKFEVSTEISMSNLECKCTQTCKIFHAYGPRLPGGRLKLVVAWKLYTGPSNIHQNIYTEFIMYISQPLLILKNSRIGAVISFIRICMRIFKWKRFWGLTYSMLDYESGIMN